MKKINMNLFPKQGYFFQDSDGSMHRATGWNGVIARVRSYRARAKMPPGNPAQEVIEQACARNPAHCVEENNAHAAAVRIVSLKGRLLSWLSNMLGISRKEPLRFVSPAEASRRAGICRACPLNTGIQEGCRSCKKAMTELQKAILLGRNIDPALTGCIVTGESLPVSVWLDQQSLDNPELPAHCWRKRGV